MNVRDIYTYCLQKPGAAAERPFDETTDVIKVGGKMFALMPSDASGEAGSVTLKCVPEEGELLRQQYPGTVLAGYHMNKRHWNTVLLNRKVPAEELQEMIDISYHLVVKGLTKAEKEKLGLPAGRL
ncbi:MmcQ/YjbR family DNA-binding protein [Paenibacillus sp. FJAT-26967]|uniref:MmcQ/YjbR family DNA-binding protein n=1 Tax=Paenibacillus sp. FJAT-26967 TaxID=1729690 RepID=UPI000839AD9D|nr:MmcQ/YjbR family DNA-binding protein [Paenibacillus sp. FJAT-26967]